MKQSSATIGDTDVPHWLKSNSKVHRKRWRSLKAPDTLKLSFTLSESDVLEKDLSEYESCIEWLAGLKKYTRRTYRTHVRLFCYFYNTNPDVLKQLGNEQLFEMLKKYVLHLKSIAVERSGKAKLGEVKVNSLPSYLNGLQSLLEGDFDKDINFKKLRKMLPEKIPSNIRGYLPEEIIKMYRLADLPDKCLILAERLTGARIGAFGPLQFKHLRPIAEAGGRIAFLTMYPDSANDTYRTPVGLEFLVKLEEYRKVRESWGEKVTSESYIFRNKYSFRNKRNGVPPQKEPLQENSLRRRIRTLMEKTELDLDHLNPDHSFRHAYNTTLKNSGVDPEFKKSMMGHSNGLDDVYYDEDNPESRKRVLLEYAKAVDALTIDEEFKMQKEVEALRQQVKDVPKVEDLQSRLAEEIIDKEALKRKVMQLEKSDSQINDKIHDGIVEFLKKNPDVAKALMEQGKKQARMKV
jgi:integrase